MLSLSGMRPTEPSAHGLYRDCGIMTLRSSIFCLYSILAVCMFAFCFSVLSIVAHVCMCKSISWFLDELCRCLVQLLHGAQPRYFLGPPVPEVFILCSNPMCCSCLGWHRGIASLSGSLPISGMWSVVLRWAGPCFVSICCFFV